MWTFPVHSFHDFKYYVISVIGFTFSSESFMFLMFLFNLKHLSKKKFNRKIIIIVDQAFATFLATNGIFHLITPPHTLEYNGYLEHCHRHLLKWICLYYLLSYVFATIVYLINRMSTLILHILSSYAKPFGSQPSSFKLCVFGYLCYSWLCSYSPHKLAPSSTPCIFLGYSLT